MKTSSIISFAYSATKESLLRRASSIVGFNFEFFFFFDDDECDDEDRRKEKSFFGVCARRKRRKRVAVVLSVPSSSFSSLFLLPSLLFLSIALAMQSQRRRFFPSCFDEIKDFEDGRKALLLATIPLVEERDDDEEHPRVWQGRKVSKTPIIIYMCVYVYVRESPTPLKGEEKSDKKRRYFYSNPNCVWRRKSTPLRARKNKKERRANVGRISRAVV